MHETLLGTFVEKVPGIQKDTVNFVATEPFAVVTYLVEADYQGKRYIQSNANYYGYRDGNCIDFHVSQAILHDSKIDYSNMLEFSETFAYYK